MVKFLKLFVLFFLLDRIATLLEVSDFAHKATIVTITMLLVFLPEKHHP